MRNTCHTRRAVRHAGCGGIGCLLQKQEGREEMSEKAEPMVEYRCTGTYRGKPCNALLLKAQERTHIEAKCHRCNQVNIFYAERPERR